MLIIALISLCVREGGRTLKDAHDEIREAVDFCRYYAAQGRVEFNEQGKNLTSPTGESNVYKLEPRGITLCISPWNFPIAIFTGQIVAALMAGNAVIAKPAEQTSITGQYIAKLMHKAGVPADTLNLIVGDGSVGAALCEHNDLSAIAFTGSNEVAHSINRTIAIKDGAITKLIAETGGQNAMIVDSSALTEQVVDDVILSAFGSAGQRCSAAEASLDQDVQSQGHFFAPVIYEIPALDFLETEIFGPVLHIIRFKSDEIDSVIDDINAQNFGLTFGVHSRIEGFIKKITTRIHCGNIYVNRGTIGAVVGVQPFGGRGLSGTGPKAGGPQYLYAFATEKVISTDTTAAGGNASLVMISE